MPTLIRDQITDQSDLFTFILLNGNITNAYKIEYAIFDSTGGTDVKIFPLSTDRVDVTNEPGKFETGSYWSYDPGTGTGWQVPSDENIGTHTIKWWWKPTLGSQESFASSEFTVLSAEATPENEVMTVQQLKDCYLFGIDLTDDRNKEMPNYVLEKAIRIGISKVELKLDLHLLPTILDEKYDYYYQDADQYFFVRTYKKPIRELLAWEIEFPPGTVIINFLDNPDWVRVYENEGQLMAVPVGGQFTSINTYIKDFLYNPLLRGIGRLPQLYRVKYKTGFAPGEIPEILLELVGKYAAIHILNIMGDLILGPGIAGENVNVDGISTGVQSTASATASGYSARIFMYHKEIREDLKEARKIFKGISMVVA